MFKLYFWAHGDKGWLGEAAALSIHMVPHPPQTGWETNVNEALDI